MPIHGVSNAQAQSVGVDKLAPPSQQAGNLPHQLADVALVDAGTFAAAASISLSQLHKLVREGRAPSPVLRAPRCTRWRMSDVRAWLIAQATPSDDQRTINAARKASAAARTKIRTANRGEA